MKIKAKLEPGRVAVVTGGSSGIGKAIACGLAERSMHVWLLARRNELLDSACKEVEAHRKEQSQLISTVSVDVSNRDQVHKVVNDILDKSGSIDLLVNSAGVTHPGYVEALEFNIFTWMMEVNYFGTVYMTKEVLPAMLKCGSGYILNISSVAGFIAGFGYTAYGASKFAVRGFSDALRQEMKLHGIGVSTMFPSDTDTPQLAYENEFKPPETKALASFVGSMSAQSVANTAIKGIERGQYYIIPGVEGKVWIVLDGIARGLINFSIDQVIANAYRKKKSSQSKEA